MDPYQSLVTVNPVTLIAQICNLFIQLLIVKIFFLDKIKAVLDKRRETATSRLPTPRPRNPKRRPSSRPMRRICVRRKPRLTI